MTHVAYLGMGANLGEPDATLLAAVDALAKLPGTAVAAVSPNYTTEPVGFLDQPLFRNLCVRLQTTLSPEALLGACLGIEAAMGRLRPFKNAPRVLDIDVLLYEGEERSTPELTLPHPRMFERAFVLVPLMDVLLPDAGCRGLVERRLEAVGTKGVEKHPAAF